MGVIYALTDSFLLTSIVYTIKIVLHFKLINRIWFWQRPPTFPWVYMNVNYSESFQGTRVFHGWFRKTFEQVRFALPFIHLFFSRCIASHFHYFWRSFICWNHFFRKEVNFLGLIQSVTWYYLNSEIMRYYV